MGEAGRTRIGSIRKPHGIKGGVKISAESGIMATLPEIETFFVNTGMEWQSLHLEGLAGTTDDPIFYFKELRDRNDVEALRNVEVWVEQIDLPPLEDGEFYASDLVDCEVFDEDGELLGKVREVTRPGQHEVLHLDAAEGEIMIPFVDGWILEVDIQSKKIIVDRGEEI